MSSETCFAASWRLLREAMLAASVGGEPPIVLCSLPLPAEDDGPAAPISFIQGPPGRNIALAIGLRAAQPNTPLVLIMNADSITLGTNHLIHAARRNIDMVLLLLRSELTDPAGEALDRTAWSMPARQRALETVPTPLDWVTALGAAYVGRARIHVSGELRATLREAMATRGFSVVGITAAEHLPTGTLSSDPHPEYFAAYREWAAPLFSASAAARNASRISSAPRGPSVPRREIRIAGLGGQGVKLAGTVLSEAAGLHGGLWTTQRGDYGSATRGGPSSVDIVIGSDPITYPSADHADLLIVLSQAAADRHAKHAKRGGVVIADESEVKRPPEGALCAPITALAREHTGKPIAAGMVALGCVAAVFDAVPLEAIHRSIKDNVPAALATANVAACTAGYAATREALKGVVHG